MKLFQVLKHLCFKGYSLNEIKIDNSIVRPYCDLEFLDEDDEVYGSARS